MREVHKLFVATAVFPGCGECSVVYEDKAYCSCTGEGSLEATGITSNRCM